MQETVDDEVSKMIGKSLVQICGFANQRLVGERNIADKTGNRREGLELGEAQHVGRLVDLAPVAVEDALVGVVGEENGDLGGTGELGPGLLQGLADGAFGNWGEARRPVAGFDLDGDFERRGAQLALSSLAVAPS